MKIFIEDEDNILVDANYKIDYFEYEVQTKDNCFNMHDYIIENRNKIFGQNIYLIHEETLSNESSVDFIGFNDLGAILLIEVKRAGDSRNRQEVLSQIGKYSLDSLSINGILQEKERFLEKINENKLKNIGFSPSLIPKIENNIKQNSVNLFLITEDASDELLTSCYHFSFGVKFQKINVIEIKRIEIENKMHCIIRYFNKQGLISTARKPKFDLSQKINLIKDDRIREEIKKQIDRWEDWGWRVEPLSISTPEKITFEWRKGQSIWASFYILEKKLYNYSDKVIPNSVVIHYNKNSDTNKYYLELLNWFNELSSTYIINVNNKGKTGSYQLLCIDISNYESDQIDIIFDKLNQLAVVVENKHNKNHL